MADGWRPNEGDTLDGTVTDLMMGTSNYGDYPIMVVKCKTGEVAVHAFHYTLRSQLESLRPTIGDTIHIVYEGRRPTKDGTRTAAIYRVRVDGKVPDVWGSTPRRTVVASDVPVPTEDDLPF